MRTRASPCVCVCLRHTVEKVVGEAEAKLKELAHPDPYTSEQRTHAPRLCRERDPPLPPWLTPPKRVASHTPHPCVPFAFSLAVPHMPGGSKYMRHPFNAAGFPPEVRRPLLPHHPRRPTRPPSRPLLSHTYSVACRLSDPAHTELLQVSHRPAPRLFGVRRRKRRVSGGRACRRLLRY